MNREVDYRYLVQLIRNQFALAFPDYPDRDLQDKVQLMSAEILDLRRQVKVLQEERSHAHD